jgi:hypothetical protein
MLRRSAQPAGGRHPGVIFGESEKHWLSEALLAKRAIISKSCLSDLDTEKKA